MKRLYIYTMDACPYCAELKRMLLEEKISFFNVDIEVNEELYLPVLEGTGSDYLPAAEIKNAGDGSSLYLVPERDFKHLNACVQLIKENLKTTE
jgi:glutaredoxin